MEWLSGQRSYKGFFYGGSRVNKGTLDSGVVFIVFLQWCVCLRCKCEVILISLVMVGLFTLAIVLQALSGL